MNMTPKIIQALLSGQFICQHRFPVLYEWLQDGDHSAEVASLASAIGYRLSRLGEHGAWFASHAGMANLSPDQRRAIRQQFKDVKQEHWPRIQFLMTAQRALDDEMLLTPGSLVDLSALVDGINKRPKLLEDYRNIIPLLSGARVGATLHDNLRRSLDSLCSEGYLVVRNAEREMYMVTGKIEYLHQLIELLLENEPSAAMAEEDAGQGDLLAPASQTSELTPTQDLQGL